MDLPPPPPPEQKWFENVLKCLRTLKIMARNLNAIVRLWIRLLYSCHAVFLDLSANS
jgi:hypothetical protein